MLKSKNRISKILQKLHSAQRKGLAWLIDPDKIACLKAFQDTFDWVAESDLDLIFVGGSQLGRDNFVEVVRKVKSISGDIPVVLFPGSSFQVDEQADGILFLSLLSGRNPEYLIGQQVQAAPRINQMDIEVLPTAYLLVNDQDQTSVQNVSQTTPLSNTAPDFVEATALAGKFLGMDYCYLEAGSGASIPVAQQVISQVKSAIDAPLIVGGGIDTVDKANRAFYAGADLIVVGNAIEKDPGFLAEVLACKSFRNASLNVN
ncbi:geranylgeranylglyceryl/heptaprenylglyceryl phosphate synthase [Algoriphagus halophytocola]|uniref:geranylgeranylglyceryl/heptaprenylglyceryl phosphate synthase n=1 Tax=Algoriphagus halophytocola TaxID=2991499 RepID=UPI0022DE5CE9|nr:geranylgeranylglyceryl/heptaprenylglyceryl phosphate synthase [Algoriphagus sp. TR-M9]WBL42542.1 geranylgeranylglyceryl/heptaprenylglyceryl phosphate synthase [Algoriphagus sp. TR-M9]